MNKSYQKAKLLRQELADEVAAIIFVLDGSPPKAKNIVGRLGLLQRLDVMQRKLRELDEVISEIRQALYYREISN